MTGLAVAGLLSYIPMCVMALRTGASEICIQARERAVEFQDQEDRP